MNKKLFTLAVSALALLAGSLSVEAQTPTWNATFDASREVMYNQSAAPQLTVTSINPNKWYHILGSLP